MVENNKIQYLFPEIIRILTGSSLKFLALIAMFIDHIALVLLSQLPIALEPIITIGSHQITIYLICRMIGRIAFPIYAFLIVEGYSYTSDKKKYGRNLLIFAMISEIPWNLVHTGTCFCSSQNVFFTLFLGYLGICTLEKYHNNYKKMAVCLLGLLASSIFLRSDYGCSGFGFILFLYITRQQKLIQMVVGSCILSSRWVAGLAFLPINMYNGKRGFIKGRVKYIFYIAYPLHMLILFVIRKKVFGY